MNWRHFTLIQRDGHSVYLVLLCNYHLKTLALYRKKSSPCFRIRDTSARRTSLVPREKEGKRRGVTSPSTPTRYALARDVCRGGITLWPGGTRCCPAGCIWVAGPRSVPVQAAGLPRPGRGHRAGRSVGGRCMMTDVACFCGCLYSFDGGAGACPGCGEVAAVTAGPAAAGTERGRQGQPGPAANRHRRGGQAAARRERAGAGRSLAGVAKVRRAHMCLGLRVTAVIAILCASLTTACSSGADNSAVSSHTGLSPSGGPTGPGSPASPTPSTAAGSTAPASLTPSALPTYNQNTVSPTAKPTGSASGVISLGNIGSPTVDSRHPNGSAGHMIPWAGTSSSPHCILIYNASLPQALTIVSVSFQVDVAGSGDAGPLQFAVHNSDQNCGWLHAFPGPSSVRAPTCGGQTLPPLTGNPLSGPACVLRLDFPAPDSNVDRTGHFNFIFQTQCADRAVAPCNLLTEQPTAAHPVTVQWSPGPFYVAACGRDALQETDTIAAQGKCLDASPSASSSSSSSAASSSAALAPSS